MNIKFDVCGDFLSGIYFGGKSCRACKDGDQIKTLKKQSNLNNQVRVVIQIHVIQNIFLLSC